MGPDPLAGQRVQQLIPAGAWQAGCLVPGGRHALFGCTMAPGFTGGCFEAAQPEVLIAQYPQQAATIRRLAVIGAALAMPAGFAP
jgi:predicted cupin superfamily sugar epimerase